MNATSSGQPTISFFFTYINIYTNVFLFAFIITIQQCVFICIYHYNSTKCFYLHSFNTVTLSSLLSFTCIYTCNYIWQAQICFYMYLHFNNSQYLVLSSSTFFIKIHTYIHIWKLNTFWILHLRLLVHQSTSAQYILLYLLFQIHTTDHCYLY